jgi:hypothetical protein
VKVVFELAARPSDRAFRERVFGLKLAYLAENPGSIPVIGSL